jgi:hypothetical protein
MSLLGFQRAMSALAASPELVKAVRADADAALVGFDLTPLEHRRVAAAAAQRGMVINCGLHRTNRIGNVLEMLPLTVFVIGNEIRRVADLFWAEYPNPDFTARRELHRFGAWVRRALDGGTIASPFLREVLDYELHVYDLGMLPRKRVAARIAEAAGRFPDGAPAMHPMVRLARFVHEPAALMTRLRDRRPLPYDDLPEGEFYLLLDVRGAPAVGPMDPELGRALRDVEDGVEVDEEMLAVLDEDGLLVRTAPAPPDATAAEAPELAAAM